MVVEDPGWLPIQQQHIVIDPRFLMTNAYQAPLAAHVTVKFAFLFPSGSPPGFDPAGPPFLPPARLLALRRCPGWRAWRHCTVVEASTPQTPVVRRPMIRWLLLAALALFILLPPPALTTVPDRASPPSARVAGLEHELMSAIQARDGQRLDDLIAADCELTGAESDVERVDKHAYVTAALDPDRLTIDDFRFVDLTTATVANDVAIVRTRLDRRGWLRGRPISDRLLLTDVWKQRDGRWQLVSRHASPAASGGRGKD